jgi:hypothetical protein
MNCVPRRKHWTFEGSVYYRTYKALSPKQRAQIFSCIRILGPFGAVKALGDSQEVRRQVYSLLKMRERLQRDW